MVKNVSTVDLNIIALARHLKSKAALSAADKIVSAERLELSTNGLKGHCSAIELRAHAGTVKRTAFYHGKVVPST